MSGGVDSSVAAALLVEKRHEVIGITMNLFSLPKEICRDEGLKSCCGWKAIEDAHNVAIKLGIPHYVADFREDFGRAVIVDFCREYSCGRTPNPCIRCNEHIKFKLLLRKAKKMGADFIATGHHARLEYDSRSRRFLLRKGKDKEKDQSYFLYSLTQEQLSPTWMPIGDMTKKEVRIWAEKLELPVAAKPESQEICFVPDNDYASFLKVRLPEAFRPGPIVDINNQVLGQHDGIAHFTVGQRRGMGIAAAHPLYVLAIDGNKNTITVGRDEDLYSRRLFASCVNWIAAEHVKEPVVAKAKLRYKHMEAKALLTPLDSSHVRVDFERPQRAITPGQSIVFYKKDLVLGGGIIEGKFD